jgi:hypothetical protein
MLKDFPGRCLRPWDRGKAPKYQVIGHLELLANELQVAGVATTVAQGANLIKVKVNINGEANLNGIILGMALVLYV